MISTIHCHYRFSHRLRSWWIAKALERYKWILPVRTHLWTLKNEITKRKWNKTCLVDWINRRKRKNKKQKMRNVIINGIHISNKIMHILWRIALITFYFCRSYTFRVKTGERALTQHPPSNPWLKWFLWWKWFWINIFCIWREIVVRCTIYNFCDIISLNVEWTGWLFRNNCTMNGK